MDSSKISQTSMEVLEKLDTEKYESYTISHVGIVVIIENDEDCAILTRSSTNKFHEKLGMWGWAVRNLS